MYPDMLVIFLRGILHMRLFSKASRYAIRAMMSIPEAGSPPSFSTKHSCERAEIPEAYARKALQEMTKAGILKGIPGRGGGYVLLRKLSEVSLLDIVLAVDGENTFAECPMGLRCESQTVARDLRLCEKCNLPTPKCGLSHVCPIHDLWKRTRKSVINYLETTTIQNIRNNPGRVPSHARE
ncbi:MAG: Rrf2 family transcriptional regulator [Candidatus Abyssobacteria bacterium SURF_17]|jgi:Rrf2 family protein|uniref:Rrf2 family transcriptional regulator n=1 Tax=Candidatus Abyssobacteria bacterium SURF_17 TaxID=2093361 RepID=A0A419F6V0_9BACT|nr:MAG: Rrf2 family transcriptional regulator [Candidatus Abyssubacteria bacterium SURF_17]